MEFKDNRGKRIVYVCNCLMNQNSRFPGLGIKEGAFVDLVDILLMKGLGIEQLPCLECLGWGGVARSRYFYYQALIFRAIRKNKYFLVKPFMKMWFKKYERLCKKEAKKVVKRMENFTKEGYTITGIVAANDSPTCGVTKTIDIMDIAENYKELGYELEEFEYPQIDKMKNTIPLICKDGSGYFMGNVISELKKKKLDVKVVGFETWAESPKEESERIAKELGL